MEMKSRSVIAGLVMLLTVLSAFAITPATPAAAAAEEDVLFIAMQEDFTDFNYWNLITNTVWKDNVIGFCFETLAGLDYDMIPYPLLAEDWTFYDTNLTIVIKLREGVKFHDGTPLTADDVYYSYLMARSGDTTTFGAIADAFDDDENGETTKAEIDAGIQVTGTYTLRMTMAKTYGQFFVSTLAGVPIAPKDIWEHHLSNETEVLMDVGWNHVDSTIGTGAWYYSEGVENSYRVLRKFEDYWGKDFRTPYGYPNYPKTIDVLHYKLYTSLDTAILALQSGEADFLPWAITPGRVPALQSDPNIGLEYMADSGYFYLAFNQKREPMNNLSFRRAVSHMIDKNQIVNVYMGGFGQAGSAAVPPYFGEWFNPSVATYPFDMDLANQMLDDAGYVDVNGDGWRDLPDGRLMDKITLITPPADYDPIRIRAGQMIATNMRAAGINIEAKPIDFNTLVAIMSSYDYGMLELGWRFEAAEAVSVVDDICDPNGTSNYWGWWSLDYPNPHYSDVGGVVTLADAESQQLAKECADALAGAKGTFDIAEQIAYTKQVEEIVCEAVPFNVLYYRVNVEAYSNVYTNWTAYMGSLINVYTLSRLDYSGKAGPAGGGVVTNIDAGLTVPEKVKSGDSVDAYVLVIDNNGDVVSEASVTIDVVGTPGDTVTASPASGTTDAAGVFEFSLTGTEVGMSTVYANATKGSLSASDSAAIRTATKGGVGVVLTPDDVVLTAGQSTDITVLVKDTENNTIEGANVSVDPYLLGYGTISPTYVSTDANGLGTLTYTAPATAGLNQHYLATVSCSVTAEGYTITNVAATTLIVKNAAAAEWRMTTIDSVTTTALTNAANQTTITVKATDDQGNALAAETLDVTYSNESMVFDSVPSVITDGSGMADVAVTLKDMADSGALMVTIGNDSVLNSISDSVTLTFVGTNPPAAPMYGGYVTYSAAKFIGALGTVNATFKVWDQTGAPANGTNASIVVSATSYGQLTDWANAEYNSLWDYAGISIVTSADNQNIPTAGSFSANFTDWEPFLAGVVVTGGEFTLTIDGVSLAHLDLAPALYLVSDGKATYNGVTGNYDIFGTTTIGSMYGYGRAYAMAALKYEMTTPAMSAKTSNFDTGAVWVTVVDENGAPLEGATVNLYQTVSRNSDFGVKPNSTAGATSKTVPQTTDADGMAYFSVIGAIWNADEAEFLDPVTATTPNLFVSASLSGALGTLAQTAAVFKPLRPVAFAEMDAITEVQQIGSAVVLTTTVTDADGVPIADVPVTVSTDVGDVVGDEVATDENGKAKFAVDTSGLTETPAAFMAAQVVTGGAPEVASARIMVALQNRPPTISANALIGTADPGLVPNVTIAGAVFDSNGLAEVTIKVDSGSPTSILAAAGEVEAAIEEVLEDLAAGDHTVTIAAEDALGVNSELEIEFSVEEVAEEKADVLAWGLAAAGWIVAIIVIVLLLMKMRAAAKLAAPEMPETEEKKE